MSRLKPLLRKSSPQYQDEANYAPVAPLTNTFQVTTTVLHNDGRLWPSGGIGSPGCYSGHSGVDYSLVYQPVLAAANGTVTVTR